MKRIYNRVLRKEDHTIIYSNSDRKRRAGLPVSESVPDAIARADRLMATVSLLDEQLLGESTDAAIADAEERRGQAATLRIMSSSAIFAARIYRQCQEEVAARMLAEVFDGVNRG